MARENKRQFTTAERFWAKVNKTDRCWLWTAATLTDGGYGTMTVRRGGRTVSKRAHRLSWELHFGEIPPGMEVCHRCDNPLCIRPDHLFLGTHTDNMRDMARKGRGNQGERHSAAKLSDAQVADIRRRRANGERQCDLAKEYRVADSHISHIIKGKVRKAAASSLGLVPADCTGPQLPSPSARPSSGP